MGKSSKLSVSYNATHDLDEVAGILRTLLNSLEDRKVVIQKGVEHIVLTPGSVVELELTGKQKKDRQSIELELSWRVGSAPAAAEGLAISSTEPPPIEPPSSASSDDAEDADDADGDDD